MSRGILALSNSPDREADVVVIGSGIGGLSAAALCARYGLSVEVLESHYHAGGVAHGFEISGYHFDAGVSRHTLRQLRLSNFFTCTSMVMNDSQV